MHFVQEIFSFFLFFLKQLFTGYAEDRQTRLRFLINVTLTTCCGKKPRVSKQRRKLITQRLTLFFFSSKQTHTSTPHINKEWVGHVSWNGESRQLMPSEPDTCPEVDEVYTEALMTRQTLRLLAEPTVSEGRRPSELPLNAGLWANRQDLTQRPPSDVMEISAGFGTRFRKTDALL